MNYTQAEVLEYLRERKVWVVGVTCDSGSSLQGPFFYDEAFAKAQEMARFLDNECKVELLVEWAQYKMHEEIQEIPLLHEPETKS